MGKQRGVDVRLPSTAAAAATTFRSTERQPSKTAKQQRRAGVAGDESVDSAPDTPEKTLGLSLLSELRSKRKQGVRRPVAARTCGNSNIQKQRHQNPRLQQSTPLSTSKQRRHQRQQQQQQQQQQTPRNDDSEARLHKNATWSARQREQQSPQLLTNAMAQEAAARFDVVGQQNNGQRASTATVSVSPAKRLWQGGWAPQEVVVSPTAAAVTSRPSTRAAKGATAERTAATRTGATGKPNKDGKSALTGPGKVNKLLETLRARKKAARAAHGASKVSPGTRGEGQRAEGGGKERREQQQVRFRLELGVLDTADFRGWRLADNHSACAGGRNRRTLAPTFRRAAAGYGGRKAVGCLVVQ